MSGTILQSGSLSDLPLLDLFLSARNAPFPATLSLRRPGQERVFVFGGGGLRGLRADHPSEHLASMLVRRRKLERDQGERAAAAAAAEGVPVLDVILRDELVAIEELSFEASLWATALVVQSFSWTEGTFELSATDSEATVGEGLLSVRLGAALARGVLKHLSADVARIYLAPWLAMGARWSPDAPFSVDDFDLNDAHRAFVDALDGNAPLGDAISQSGLPEEEALRVLFLLQRAECLQMVPLAEIEPAPPPDPEPGDFDLDDLLDAFDAGQNRAPDPPKAAPPPSRPAPAPAPPGDVVPRRASEPLRERPQERPRQDEVTTTEGPAPEPVDFSAIRFHRGAARQGPANAHSTVHVERPGAREQVVRATGPVRVVAASAPPPDPRQAAAEGEAAARATRIAALFGGEAPPSASRLAAVPSGVTRSGTAGASGAARPAPGQGAAGRAAPAAPNVEDAPPAGPGPAIEPDEWMRLSTKEKERVRLLRDELVRLGKANYFEWFGCTPDSQLATIKKAYFVAARRYHPDALADEGPIYARLAEALFTQLTEAYDILMDDEKRTKYHKKHILGEKDEDDLAMEKVQRVLSAEGAFKQGLKLLNAGKTGDALVNFKKAVELYDEEPEYLAYLGFSTFKLREKTDPKAAEEGLAQLRAAADQRENNPRIWHLLGKAWMQKGDWDEARTYLRRSLKIQPDNTEALREYKRVDALSKGETPPGPGGRADAPTPDAKKTGLAGLFGRLSGKDTK